MATLTGLEPATSAVTGRRANQLRYRALHRADVLRAPNGVRTRATALKGRRPGPLDDGGSFCRGREKQYMPSARPPAGGRGAAKIAPCAFTPAWLRRWPPP